MLTNFFRFWYAFVFPNVSELEAGDTKGIWKYAVEPALDHYTSYIYEDICRQYLRRENRKNALPFRFIQIGRWWDKKNEIDIMATDRDRKNILPGECKYKNSRFALSDLKELQAKLPLRKDNLQLFYWLFSKSGFTEEVCRRAEEEGIGLVTLDMLVY